MRKLLSTTSTLLCLAGSTGVAIAGCPSGQAAKLTVTCSNFEWYAYLGGSTTFEAGDRLEFSFAVVPFDRGTMTVGGDEEGGRTGYQILFADGTASDADYGDLVPMLQYQPGTWSDIQVMFDFASHQAVYTVNGVSTEPRSFNFLDSRSLWSFRVNMGETSGPAVGWLDDVRVVKHTSEGSSVLFAATFDAGEPPVLFQGRMDFAPSQEAGPPPATCGPRDPTAVTTVDWQGVKSLYRDATR